MQTYPDKAVPMQKDFPTSWLLWKSDSGEWSLSLPPKGGISKNVFCLHKACFKMPPHISTNHFIIHSNETKWHQLTQNIVKKETARGSPKNAIVQIFLCHIYSASSVTLVPSNRRCQPDSKALGINIFLCKSPLGFGCDPIPNVLLLIFQQLSCVCVFFPPITHI